MVLLAKNIDVSNITVSKPNVLENGAKLIYVNYTGEKKFRIQTPKMVLPFGLNAYTEGPFPKYSVEMSYRETDSTDAKEVKNNMKIKQLHDKMLEIENKLIDVATENATSWFKLPKAKASRDIIRSKFLPSIVKVSIDKNTGEPDGKYPPTTKLKLYNKNDNWGVKLFDMNNMESLNVNDAEGPDMENVLVQNTRMKGIISCVGIWIGSGTFMCQWALSEAQLDVPEQANGKSGFVPDSDDEEESEDEEENPNASTMVPDSDDDDETQNNKDQSPEPNIPQETPAAPKKRKIVKKKTSVNDGE